MSDWLDPSERDDLILSSALPPNQRLLLVAISWHMMKGNHAFPSIDTLADRTGLSRSTVIRAINSLRGEGVLVVATRGKGNSYRIAWDDLATRANQARRDTDESPASVTVTPRQCHRDTGRPAQESPLATPTSVTVKPASVTVTLDQCHGDTPTSVTVTPEGERKGPPKEEKKGLLHELLAELRAEGGGVLGVREVKPRSMDELIAEVMKEKAGPLPVQPAIPWQEDPDLVEARRQNEEAAARERQKNAEAREVAKALDASLTVARDARVLGEKRVRASLRLFLGLECLSKEYGCFAWEASFSHWSPSSDQCWEALETLPPEVTTWDLVAALRDLRLESHAWPVVFSDGVWPGVSAGVSYYTGYRLCSELGVYSHMEPTYLDAARKFREGKIDAKGNRLPKE